MRPVDRLPGRRPLTVQASGQLRHSEPAQGPGDQNGELGHTSTRLPGGGATVEVARRQPDGSWRWVIDQPAVLS